MLTTRLVVFAVMLTAFYEVLDELFSLSGLLYLGQQWSWLGAFFIAIVVSMSVTWMLVWNIGRIVVSYRQEKSRLKSLGGGLSSDETRGCEPGI